MNKVCKDKGSVKNLPAMRMVDLLWGPALHPTSGDSFVGSTQHINQVSGKGKYTWEIQAHILKNCSIFPILLVSRLEICPDKVYAFMQLNEQL